MRRAAFLNGGMMEQHTVTVTVTGTAGSATGSGATTVPVYGKLYAVHLDYIDQAATCDVTVTTGSPAQTLLTVTNANTDAWFYPRVQVDSDAGAPIADEYDVAPVSGYVTVSVAQSNAGSVVATLLIED